MSACRPMHTSSLIVLAAELQAMQTLIGSIEKRIMTQHRGNEASKRLRTDPRYRHRRRDCYRSHRHGPEGIPVGP